jgi:cyanophycinase
MHHLFLLTAALISQPPDLPKGILVIVGGGPTTPEIVKRTLAYAGGEKARVLIIPQASFKTSAGPASAQMWRKAGARKVTVLEMSQDRGSNRFILKDKKTALDAIKEADLIWMPGGSQSRLMQALTEGGLAKAICDRFKEGATVGGTSAGAAVMSKHMLVGGEGNMDILTAGAIKTADGLGLCPDLIVDQHFQRKDRSARLLLAVLTHRQCIGIGLYEGTAVVVHPQWSEVIGKPPAGKASTNQTTVVVHPQWCEVIGKSSAIVIDARKAIKIPSTNGEPEAAVNLSMHLLKAGLRFDMAKGVVLPTPQPPRQTVSTR